jgi:transcriptional regulator GlxA family with amidase domain
VVLTPNPSPGTGHTVIFGGGLEQTLPTAEVMQTAALWSQGASRWVGVCMGSFVLGELGLLEGRRCTTHWISLPALCAQYGQAKVESDAIFVQDGPVFTSAGASAGIDLALELIRQDGGPKLARAVAKSLVMFVQRPGGQSQFGSAARLPARTEQAFRDLVAQIQADPAADHRVETLAQTMGMSPRNFARRFKTQTGHTPASMVVRLRVQAAQRLLVNSDAGLSQIASECGFGSEETLRRSFERICGTSPGGYRQRFL